MIESIRFRNYLCFRGDHEIRLGPKVYALVASRREDAESSNGGGKSALIESPALVLYGWHRWPSEDELITRGEAGFEVEMTFAGGHRACRSRLRGKRTTIRYWPPGCDPARPLVNDEADAALAALVGLSLKDFQNSAFFRQKEMSRFVTQEPGPRQKTIAAWFRLDALEACEKDARAIGAGDETSLRVQDAAIDRAVKRRDVLLGKSEDGTYARTPESYEDDSAAAALLEDAAKKTVEELHRAIAEAEARAIADVARAKAREQFQVVCEDGKRQRDVVAAEATDEMLAAASAASAAASAAVVAANDAVARARGAASEKRRLLIHGFDGTCPVARIQCPATATINADAAGRKAASDEADAALARELAVFNEADAAYVAARGVVESMKAKRESLARLRERAKTLMEQMGQDDAQRMPIDVARARLDLDEATKTMLEARATAERARGILAELGRLATELREAEAKKAEIEERLGTIREAVVLFKAAQRRIAESTLGGFEDEANEALAESRVLGFENRPLTMSLRWSRETGDPAKACGSCGSPFPTSARVKSCACCGAPRGLHQENKLNVVLSDQSGALDDWAGCLFQLAAARWLREDRSSPWDTVLIDEPFGALDARNRKAMARHFAKCLPEFSSQSIVIAHSPDVTSALPGRIEIDVTASGSVPRVVA